MAKPVSKPDWTDGDPAKVAEPTVGKKLSGWFADERPSFKFLNWLFFNITAWITYFDTQLDLLIASSIPVQNAIAQEQLTPANLTGLLFDKTLIRGFSAEYQLDRRTDSSNVVEIGTIKAMVDPEANTWLPIIQDGKFDDGLGEGNVTLDIVPGTGQIRYVSVDIPGANHAAEFRVFNIIKYTI